MVLKTEISKIIWVSKPILHEESFGSTFRIQTFKLKSTELGASSLYKQKVDDWFFQTEKAVRKTNEKVQGILNRQQFESASDLENIWKRSHFFELSKLANAELFENLENDTGVVWTKYQENAWRSQEIQWSSVEKEKLS